MITSMFHDSMFCGAHAGRDKTLENLKDKFYFKNMHKYISAYVKSCHICQLVKDPRSSPHNPLGHIEADYPLDLISLDIWSPGVTSRSNNKFVLTVIDGFTKFVWCKALPDKTAAHVASALFEFVTTFGVPFRVHSDCGKEFVNEVIHYMSEKLLFNKSTTTVYHPQGNAYAERVHKFFRQAIASFAQDDHRIWDEILPVLIACYNDSYHTTIGCTPAKAWFGRGMNIPPLSKSDIVTKEYTTLGYAYQLEYILSKTYSLTHDLQKEKIARNKQRSDLMTGDQITFKEGDKVLLYRPQVLSGDSRKISIHWYGPYTITKMLRNGKVFYLDDPFGDPLKYPISISHIKKYVSRNDGDIPFTKFPDNIESQPSKILGLDDESSPNVLLNAEDTVDTYVLPRVIPDNVDSKERAVLEELKSGDYSILSRPLRPSRKPKKVRQPQTKTSSGRKVRQKYY